MRLRADMSNAPMLIEKMYAGHGAGDADQLFRAAHSLKGAVERLIGVLLELESGG